MSETTNMIAFIISKNSIASTQRENTLILAIHIDFSPTQIRWPPKHLNASSQLGRMDRNIKGLHDGKLMYRCSNNIVSVVSDQSNNLNSYFDAFFSK